MIKGYFDNSGNPRLNIEVSGIDKQTNLSALIDTGFNGDLSLPVPIAISLGLKLIYSTEVILADGSTKSELLFAGGVMLAGKTTEAYIFLTGGEDALIGTNLLKKYTLKIDFAQQKIELENRS